MKIYIAFLKKEILENYRNKRFLILMIVFLLFGLMSPVTAKLTPIILKSIVMNGMTIKGSEPVEMDSWIQFFKNIEQIGMFVLVLMFSGLISVELQKGTLINLLSKGLPRPVVIFAKFSISILMWFISYGMSFLLTYIYTGYFFGNTINIDTLLLAASLPFLFGILLISMEILGGVIFGSSIGSLSLAGIVTVIQFLISIKSEWSKVLPLYILSHPLSLLNGADVGEYTIAISATVVLSITALIGSVLVMNKKQMS